MRSPLTGVIFTLDIRLLSAQTAGARQTAVVRVLGYSKANWRLLVRDDPGDRMSATGPVVIDGGDRSCVRLLLELRSELAGLPAGTIVHLIASDPAAPLDLAAWCHLTGHTYLGRVPPPYGDAPTYGLRVAATPRATAPGSPWRPGA